MLLLDMETRRSEKIFLGGRLAGCCCIISAPLLLSPPSAHALACIAEGMGTLCSIPREFGVTTYHKTLPGLI